MTSVESEIKLFEELVDKVSNSKYHSVMGYVYKLANTKGLGVRYANTLLKFFAEGI
jgi:hypothetical protein